MEGHFAFQVRRALPDTDGAGAAVAVELPAKSKDAPKIVATAAAAALLPMPMGPTSAGRDLCVARSWDGGTVEPGIPARYQKASVGGRYRI
jgi:hypothetical protein